MSEQKLPQKAENHDSIESGLTSLSQAVRNRFPNLTDGEIRKIVNIILEEITKRIDAGEQIAFLTKNPDGTHSLTVLGLEVKD